MTQVKLKLLKRIVSLILIVWYPKGIVPTEADLNDIVDGKCNTSTNFEIEEPRRIVSFFPETGSEFGGTNITIKGYGFDNYNIDDQPIHCCFNETRVLANYISNEELHCDTPPSMPGRVFLSLCPAEESHDISEREGSSRLIFTYTIMATVHSLTPSSGSGGNEVEITGSGFVNSSSLCCRFNDTVTSATFISDSRIQCTVPRLNEAIQAHSLVTVSNNGVDIEGDWSSVNFMYYPPPTITSIDPIVTPSTGGTNIFVRGNNFPAKQPELLTSCKFGDFLANATVLSHDELVCILPSIDTANTTKQFTVEVSINGGYEFQTNANVKLIVHSPVSVLKVIPDSVPETGNTVVSVFGENFVNNPNLACKFDFVTVPVFWISTTLVNCTVPPSRTGTISLRISSNGQVSGLSPKSLRFTYIDATTLTSIKPESGPYVGGTLVNLLGTGFQKSPSFICRFGNEVATAVRIMNNTAAQCIVPRSTFSSEEKVSIDVSANNGHDFTSSGLKFIYKKLHVISNIEPRSGPSLGNTTLKLYGNFSGLDQTRNACRFTYKKVEMMSEIIEKSQTQLVCETPRIELVHSHAHATTNVDLIDIDDEARISLTSNDILFTFYPPTFLQKLEPDVGSELGGTNVTVLGRFTRSNDLVCKFGDVVGLSAHWISKEKITCISPPATEAFLLKPEIPVTVLTNGIDNEGISLTYHYIIASHASTAKPDFGPISGGTSILVEGSGFPYQKDQNNKALCSFGKILVEARVLSESAIRCKSPLHTSGTVTVSITFNNGHEYISSTAFFTFVENPTIFEISPTYITSGENTKISVMGEKFNMNAIQNRVPCFKFGNFTMRADVVNETFITFDYPPVQKRTVSRVKLALNGVDLTPFGPVFSIYPPPKVDSISPDFSNENGGIPISITGSGFYDLPSFSCIFKFSNEAKVIVNAKYITFSLAECITPPMSSVFTQIVDVELTLSGTALKTNPTFEIEYFTAISVSSIFPRLFPKGGGSKVTIRGHGFHQQKNSYVCRIDECNYTSVHVQAEYISDGILKCEILPSRHQRNGTSKTHLSIGVVVNEQFYEIGENKDDLTFNYYDEIVLDSIIPRMGSVNGGSTVAINGHNFVNSISISCSFSMEDVRFVRPAKFISHNSISCLVPSLTDSNRMKTVALVQVSNNGLDFSVDGLPFHYQMQMEIESADPVLLEENVQYNMNVFGKHFINSHELKCIFSNGILEQTSTATFISHTIIQCSTPSVMAAGTYDLSLKSFNIFSADVLTIEVYPKISIREILPSNAICEGTELTLIGNFPNSTLLHCKFGNTTTVATFISNQEIHCIMPTLSHGPSTSTPNITLSVAGNGRDFVNFDKKLNHKNRDECTERDPLSTYSLDTSTINKSIVRIESITPTIGTVEGGQKVRIKGSGLKPNMNASCRFGLYKSIARVVRPNNIECETPKSNYPGIVSVDVADHGSKWTESNLTYEYIPLVKVADIQPKIIPSFGGSIVHLTVSTINTNWNIFCSFGIAGIVDAVIMSPTFLSCVAPVASAIGSFPFDIFIGDKTILSHGPIELQYIDLVSFTISPKFGQIEGNTMLNLRFDKEFSQDINLEVFACTFDFGGDVTMQSDLIHSGQNTFSCLTPNVTKLYRKGQEMMLSHVHVKSRLENFTMTQSSQTFTFKTKPKVLEMTPKSGDINGGTKVTLQTNRSSQDMIMNSDSVICMFGTAMAAQVKWISKYRVECVSPPNSASDGSKVQLFFAENGFDFTLAGTFSYVAKPSIFKPKVHYAYTNVLSHIRLSVLDLYPDDNPTCIFEKLHTKELLVSPALAASANSLNCSIPLPNGASEESMKIYVSNNGQELSTTTSLIHFLQRPQILAVTPASGISDKKTNVLLNGTDFIKNISWQCTLLGEKNFFNLGIAHSLTSTSIQCEVKCPRVDQATTYQLTLLQKEDHGKSEPTSSIAFTCYPEPKILKITPSVIYTQSVQKLEIEGDNFSPNHLIDCVYFGSFGKVKANAIRNTNHSIVSCFSPKILAPEVIRIEIGSRNGINFGNNGFNLQVILPPVIDEVEKQSIVPGGGFRLKGYFKTLLNDVNCRVDKKYFGKIERLETNETTICAMPSHVPPNNYTEIEFVFANAVISSYQSLIQIHSQPVIYDISPPQALRLFPKTLAVWGANFDLVHTTTDNNVTCRFGMISSPAIVVSAHLIHCDTPVFFQAAVVKVSVTFGHIATSSNSHMFEALDPWKIQSIVPCSGPIQGGTNVKIIGAGPINSNLDIQCMFGESIAVAASVISNMSIQCQTPSVEYPQQMTVAVILQTSAQVISTATSLHDTEGVKRVSNAFHFFEEGRITSAKPTSNSLVNGVIEEIIIKGSWSYLKSCLHCLNPICAFGSIKTFGKVQVPSNDIKCISANPFSWDQNYPSSNVLLRVSLNGVDYSSGSLSFSAYKKESNPIEIIPASGSMYGGTPVALIGVRSVLDLNEIASVQCQFGSYPSMYAFYDNKTNEVICHTPAAEKPSKENLYLRYGAHDKWRDTGKHFHFVQEFTVSGIISNLIHIGRNDEAIVIKGDGFHKNLDLLCNFDQQYTTSVYHIDSNLVSCSVPPEYETNQYIRRRYITLVVTCARSHYSSQPFQIHFTSSAAISLIYPQIGPSNGGTLIKIEGEDFEHRDDLLCWFDDHATTANFISKSFIECQSSGVFLGSNQLVKLVSVSLSWRGLNSFHELSSASFLFYKEWGKNDVTLNPATGPSTGGTIVKVTCDVFATLRQSHSELISETDVRISFDNLELHARFLDNSIVFKTPSNLGNSSSFHNGEKLVPVLISLNGGIDYMLLPDFAMYTDPTITSVYPHIIFIDYHSDIWVRGTGFSHKSEVTCQLGTVTNVGQVVSSTAIKCPIANSNTFSKNSLIDVSISFNNQDFVSSNLPVVIKDRPSVFDLEPKFVSGDGGTNVQVTGVNFESLTNAGCSICLIHETPFFEDCTSMNVHNDSSLSFTAPSGFGTNIKLEFGCNNEYVYTASGITLAYLPSVQLISMHPQTGITYSTGQMTTIFGRFIINDFKYSCLFTIESGATSLVRITKSASIGNDLSIICEIPSTQDISSKILEKYTFINVQVMRNIDKSESNKMPFYFKNYSNTIESKEEFLSPNEIILLSPNKMKQEEVSLSTLQGKIECESSLEEESFFGKPPIEDIDVHKNSERMLNSSELPLDHYGSRELKIDGFSNATNKAGSTLGGTQLEILGMGFTTLLDQKINCWFGSKQVHAMIESDTLAFCHSPPMSKLFESLYHNTSKQSWAIPLTVNITNLHGNHESQKSISERQLKVNPVRMVSTFTYTKSEKIFSLIPKSCPSTGNTKIRIKGEGFIDSTNLSCKVGSANKTKAFYIDENTIDCIVPAAEEALPKEDSTKMFHGGVTGHRIIKTFVSVSNHGKHDHFHTSASFSYFQHPIIVDIRPTKGAAGTLVYISTITLPFLDKLLCLFGHKHVQARLLPPSTIVCNVPNYDIESSNQQVEVGISINGYHFVQSGFSFEYDENPIVHRITPTAGPSAGGNLIKVKGRHFNSTQHNIACRFEEFLSSASIIIDDETLHCIAPPRKAGKVQFSVFNIVDHHNDNYFDLSNDHWYESSQHHLIHHSEIIYSYFEDFSVEKIFPHFGSVNGNTPMKILGGNFYALAGLVCIFGGNITTSATFISTKELECYSPPLSNNAPAFDTYVQVGISNEVGITVFTASKSHIYTFTDVPFIENTYPDRGFLSGGDKIQVVGRNFYQPPDNRVVCIFGHATSIGQWLSSTEVECSTPLMSPSNITKREISQIEILGPFDLMTTEYDDCYFQLEFDGESTNKINCSIDNNKLKLELVSLPSIGEKLIDVSLENYTTFKNVLRIYKVTFSMIDDQIVNNEHLALLGVDDNPQQSSPKYKINITRLQTPCCEVQLSLNGVDYFGGFNNKTIPFIFDEKIFVDNVLPSHGSISGGTLVTLKGTGFEHLSKNRSSSSTSIFCIFGTEYSKGTLFDQHHISCVTPAFPTTAKVLVTIEIYYDVKGQGKKVESGATFQFLHNPEILKTFPSFLPNPGNSKTEWKSIEIFGKNFIDSQELGCLFKHTNHFDGVLKHEFKAKAVFHNSTYLQCQIENNEQTFRYWRDSVLLYVTTNGIDTSDGHLVEILKSHYITEIYPTLGPKNGGTLVHVKGQNFVDSEFLACKFGNMLTVQGHFKSSGAITCVTPSFDDLDNSSSIALDVTNNGYHYSSNKAVFFIHEEIKVISIDPAIGPSIGGTNIKVQLFQPLITKELNADFNYVCKFNETYVPAIREIPDANENQTFSSISCTSPPSSFQGGIVPFEVSLNNGVDFSSSNFKFHFLPGLVNEAIFVFPSHGPKYGGSIVKVSGSSLTEALSALRHKVQKRDALPPEPLCKFGDVVFPSETNNDTFLQNYITCISPDAALNRDAKTVKIDISVTGAFEDFMEIGALFAYDEVISVGEVNPISGPTKGGTPVQIKGRHFPKSTYAEISCQFCKDIVPATWKSVGEISCISPKQLETNQKKNCTIGVSLNNGIDFSPIGTFFYEPQMSITSIKPNHGIAGSKIAVYGEHFSPNYELLCHFGESDYSTTNEAQFQHSMGIPAATYMNQSHIICIAPPIKVSGFVPFHVSIDGIIESSDNAMKGQTNNYFHYDDPIVINEVVPSAGPASGNFSIQVFGGPFMSSQHQYCCRFGSKVVDAYYVSEKELKCTAPPHEPGFYQLKLSQNGQDYSVDYETFHFYKDIQISDLYPVSGPARKTGTIVKIFGENFLNTTSAVCKFNKTLVPARFLSQRELECLSPTLYENTEKDLVWESLVHHTNYQSHLFPEAHLYPLYLSKGVKVEISMNAQDFTNDGFKFLYQNDILLVGMNVAYGPPSGGTPVFFSGSGFVNTTLLSCRFGHYIQNATFLTRNLVLCFSPAHSKTYKTSDAHMSYSKNKKYLIGPEINPSSVYVEVSNNAVDFTDFQFVFGYQNITQEGMYQPGVEMDTLHICPKGSYCPGGHISNFTLCPKGTYQSLPKQQKCLRCPIGFICPEVGLPVPRICPAGFVCDVTGIEEAMQPCPAGFFCPIGTVTSATFCGLDDTSPSVTKEDEVNSMSTTYNLGELSPTIQKNGIVPPFGLDMIMGGRNSHCWDNSTGDYGLQVSMFPSKLWDEVRVLPLDLNSPTVPLRGRFCADDSCMTIQPSFSKRILMNFDFNHSSSLHPQRPIPCPIGTYCHPGTSENITSTSTKFSSYSSPQQCSGGSRYCPEATSTPFGLHKCPKGYYCHFGKKNICPVGTYCPYYDLWDPLPCQPGSYNHMLGQMNCTKCPYGHFCNGYGRVDPGICPPGFVCSQEGLASPNFQCPSGYYCPPGTQTSDPFRNDTTLRPYPCSPGTYCLSGVGYPTIMEGNFSHAQPCPPGFYCESASPSATGSGLCPPGFYCPKGTATPRPTPKGHYAKLFGTVKASTCLPGYYAPTIESSECIPCPPGTSCETEGLFVADVCPPGSYRSTKEKDDITCQSCPQGTWSKNWHLRDQSECSSCPAGSYCPIDGMTNPCSKKDLPMPFEPILNLNGVPVLEYKFPKANAPPLFSIDECLQLNDDEGSMLKLSNDQHFFFGELVPPYIDILGRGTHIRITDKESSIYGKGVQCYQNFSPHGSVLFERMANYYGPQYDIQRRGHPYQGYGSEDVESSMFATEPNAAVATTSTTLENSYLYGSGMIYIDLPKSRWFDPFLNCTHGFNLMNSTLEQSEEIVYTNANYDYEGGHDVEKCTAFDATLGCFIDPTYQLHLEGECCNMEKWTQRAIHLSSDQYYPGTCEADIICNEDRVSEAVSCQDGFVCSESTTSESSTSKECPPGYVCSFGTTPDTSLIAPNGQFANICPAGFFCESGTGLKAVDNKCPVGYICPSGTSNPVLGLLANDGLNRNFEIESHDFDPSSNMKYLAYFGGDQFQILSKQKSTCLIGIDTSLHQRYILLDDTNMINNSRTWISKQQNNFTTMKLATKFKRECARDDKWTIVNRVIQREDCDCTSQTYLLFAVYRLWQCSLRDSKDSVCMWPDSEIISPTSGRIPYIFEHMNDGYGGRDIYPTPKSILPFQSDGFLKFRNHGTKDNPDFRFLIQVENQSLQVYQNFWHLREAIVERQNMDTNAMDSHHYYDLYHVIHTIEKYGNILGNVEFFKEKEVNDDPVHYIKIQTNRLLEPITLVPRRLDICNCKNALKCPEGTTTISSGSKDKQECIWNGFEKLDRISLLPSTSNTSTSVKNSSDFSELGLDPNYPVGSLVLNPFEVAVFELNLTGLPRNMTYGSDFKMSIYEGCKPCPPRYQCKEDNVCPHPSQKVQSDLFNKCLRNNRKEVCVNKNGTSVTSNWCKEQFEVATNNTKDKVDAFEANFLMYTEPDLHKCLTIPFFCIEQEWQFMTFRKLCQDDPNGPIYDCTMKEKFEHFENWKDKVCCSTNPEFENLQSCINNQCSHDEYTQRVLEEKFVQDYMVENDFQPPISKPKGTFLMDATLQEDILNIEPLELFNRWVKPPAGLETIWQTTESCCKCKSKELPNKMKKLMRDSGFPDNKHRKITLAISALKKVQLTVVVELLDGTYLRDFSSYFHQDKNKVLHIHKPSRFEYDSNGSTWLAILEKATLDDIPSNLPLNLPIQMVNGNVNFENSFLVDEPCAQLASKHNDSNIDKNKSNINKVTLELTNDDDGRQMKKICLPEDRVILQEQENWWDNLDLAKIGDDTATPKQDSFIALPYLPFFSSCSGFDSHVGISRILEEHPDCSLVAPEVTQPVYQLPFVTNNNPIGDVCVLEKLDYMGNKYEHGASLDCQYEEKVSISSNRYQWFEIGSGKTLFHITSNSVPINIFQAEKNGQSTSPWGTSSLIYKSSKVPVTIDDVHGGVRNAIPRRVLLKLEYYQVDKYTKRLVDARLSYFDLCTTLKPEYFGGDPEMLRKMEKQGIYPCKTDYNGNLRSLAYELEIIFQPLDWFDLLNQFQFGAPIYLGFYTLSGLMSIILSSIIWMINKTVTKLRHPPKFHGFSLLKLIASPSIFGCSIAACGILLCMLTTSFWFDFLRGSFQAMKGYWYALVLDSDYFVINEKGRSGLGLMTIGYYILLSGATMLIPEKSKGELSLEVPEDGNSNGIVNDSSDSDDSPWKPRLWKRIHFILYAIFVQFLLLVFWEYTYSPMFSTNLHYFILIMKLFQIIMEIILMGCLQEKLLCVPLLVLISQTEIFIALGASNFVEFIITYFIHISIAVFHKIYLDPILKGIQSLFPRWKHVLSQKVHTKKKTSVKAKKEEEELRRQIEEEIELRNEGVDPLIDALVQNSIHMIGRYLAPFAFLLMHLFYSFSEIAKNYGINDGELSYYALFAVSMIPWTIAVDVFVLNCQELAHGWRLYDYLEYQRHRFCSREKRWILSSPVTDESVTQHLQSIDSMSFSSQYYFVVTYLSFGMFLSMLGITILLRTPDYNAFGDPAMPLIITIIFLHCKFFQLVAKRLSSVQIDYLDWRGIWGATQLEGTLDDVIAAKLAIGEGRQVDLEQERMEIEAMNDDKFRKRFLDRNRPWILQHLYELFTASSDSNRSSSLDRSSLLEHAKQLYSFVEETRSSSKKEVHNRVDVSSDDESSNDAQLLKSWDSLKIEGPSQEIMKTWLKVARKRQVLFSAIQDQMDTNINSTCTICSRKKVMCHSMQSYFGRNGEKDSSALNDLISRFEKVHPSEQSNLSLWKSYFRQNAEIITICNFCVRADSKNQSTNRRNEQTVQKKFPTRPGDISSDDENDDLNSSSFGPLLIDKDSVHGHLIGKWLNAARLELGGHFPRPEAKHFAETYISEMKHRKLEHTKDPKARIDDRHDHAQESPKWKRVQLDETGKAMITKWLATAKQRISC